MPALNVLQGLNQITYLGSQPGPFSTYNNSLCVIYATAPQGQIYNTTPGAGFYFYDPLAPQASDLTEFEPSKTYFIIAKNAFQLELSGYNIDQNTTFNIPGGTSVNFGSGPVVNGSKFLIGFDRSLSTQGIAISSVIPAGLQGISNILIYARNQDTGAPSTDIYYLSFGYGLGLGELTRFEPGSSYYILNNTLSSFTLSVDRANGAIYLITEDFRFIVTEAPGLSNIRVN